MIEVIIASWFSGVIVTWGCTVMGAALVMEVLQ
jgi:hypothetical protein